MSSDADLIVLGGGAAGLAAARTAVRLHRRVVMVQDGPVGGDCTFTGCVPSKTLLESGAAGLDFDAAMSRVRETVARIAATETADVLRREGVQVWQTRGELLGPGAVRTDAGTVRSPQIVIATGSAPARPSLAGLESVDALDTDSVWQLAERPASVVVLGGGPAGCELSQALARFGVRVTVVEAAGRLLPGHDPLAGAVVEQTFSEQGITVHTGVRPRSVRSTPAGVTVDVPGDAISAERLLLTLGRTPRTQGLAAAGLQLDAGGFLQVDDRMSTGVRGVWGAGDVTGRLLSTHAADEMGRTASLNALRRPLRLRVHESSMPRIVFTDPEVAQVGLTETEAATVGALVAELPMSAVDRAIAAGRTEGFVKLMVRPRLGTAAMGRVVGATIVAPRAGEMIHELALAVRTGTPLFRLAQTVHAYPSWSVAVRSAAALFLVEVDGRSARPAVAAR